MNTIRINNNQTQTEPVELLNFGDRLRVNGTLTVDGEEPAVLTQSVNNEVWVRGEILAESTAIRVEGVNTKIDNRGLISGDFNGIDVANGDRAFAQIINRRHGTITSESRAVNLGGVGGVLDNRGLITTSADPRNGTVYGDVTADNIFIFNSGVIDVGEGNNGDAISLELGNSINGRVENDGLVQGRGEALGNNQAAALRLYWVPAAGDTSTFNGDVINRGTLAAETGPTVVIESNTILNGDLINEGLISNPNLENGVGVRLEDDATITGTLINQGVITGGRDGIDIGNGGTAIARIENFGRIDSASRAVNLGGDQNTLINYGGIFSTADPRNGTVYGDVTAFNINIENHGLIDVGEGNNGDAISLELGAVVSGGIVNTGLVQGRGIADGTTNTASAAIRLYWVEAAGAPVSQFIGDIVNEGELATENGATVLIDNRVALDGEIVNNGLITGGIVESYSGQLAVDASGAASSITLVNTGEIVGDSLLSDHNDTYVGLEGAINGAVFGNGGNDRLFGGEFDDIFSGGTGNDLILGNAGNDQLFGGAGNDIIAAGNGHDIVTGGDGNDVLNGGRGDDLIDGGLGSDALFGGAGADSFIITPNSGIDIIFDFEVGSDRLVFEEGLSLGQVNFVQAGNNTFVIAESGAPLVGLVNVDATALEATLSAS